MKDFFGETLHENDLVAFEMPNYRELTTGIITGFTPKNIRLAYRTYHFKEGDPCLGGYTDPSGKVWNGRFITLPRTVVRAPGHLQAFNRW